MARIVSVSVGGSMTVKKGRNKAKKTCKKASNKKSVVRRGKSRLTLIQDPDALKECINAFKCDSGLNDFLDSLPRGTKSSFIIEALYKLISKTQQVECPTCKGVGKLGPNVKLYK